MVSGSVLASHSPPQIPILRSKAKLWGSGPDASPPGGLRPSEMERIALQRASPEPAGEEQEVCPGTCPFYAPFTYDHVPHVERWGCTGD